MSKTVASFVQKVGSIWLKGGFLLQLFRWLFTSVIQDTKVIVGLKLLTIGTNVTTVLLCTRKEIKSGLKLVRMETDVATHTCKLLSRKKLEHWIVNIVLLQISAK